MNEQERECPECPENVDRRGFLRTVSAGAAATAVSPLLIGRASATPTAKSPAETAVKALYESLTETQQKAVCFAWDYTEKNRGLLRTRVSANWFITPQRIKSDFYTAKQQDLCHEIFKGLINPEWYAKFLKQLKDDSGNKPWGAEQSIAIFGKPGDAKFEFVITGRHQTLRADGNTESHVAFGGPIFYGHAASGFDEKVGHPGNVYWHQALLANDLYKMLDGKQRSVALIAEAPSESAVGFRGKSPELPGLPISELTADQKTHAQKVLASLIEPYRQVDRDEVQRCLTAQGGYDQCRISFYQSGDLGDDKVWDIWRIEGPSFVWHYRGTPHVHVFVNVADDPSVKITAKG